MHLPEKDGPVNMKRCLVFELAGGIGNQLFQVAAGISVALQTSENVSFDVSRISAGTSARAENVFEGIQICPKMEPNFEIVNSKSPKILDSLSYRNSKISQLDSKFRRIYTSSKVGYDENIFNLSNQIRIRGYFQSYKYFQMLKDSGFSLNFHRDTFSKTYSDIETRVDFSNDIAVHIRRGDYAKHSNTIGLLSSTYFENAISALGPSAKIVIFSDNLVSSSFFSNGYEIVDTSGLLRESPFESLELMSRFTNVALSNSTFSWWAAALGGHPKNVVAPSPWYLNLEQPKFLIPQDWEILDSDWVI